MVDKNEAKKWLLMFLGVYILVQFISATGGTLINSLAGTSNGTHLLGGLAQTFTSTGLGGLFAANVIGLIIVVAIFYVIWKMVEHK
jgi:Co/Zn/Cd efflux system component